MHTLNQVAKDHQLLDTTRDYFQFVTTFFEVINVSATHIYHSALEQSPLSSVVRKFYYSQRPHPLPRVVMGTPDSWDDVMASVHITTKPRLYLSPIWSPCGHFVATVTNGTVEIRGALALNLLSTIQSAGVATRLAGSPAYSPDGHSLACCSTAGIIIWDTQTGGVVRKIDCEVIGQVTWSLDGKMIMISPWSSKTFTAHIYEVTSGTMQSLSKAELECRCVWAHDQSFRVMTTTIDEEGSTIDIYEVGSTLTKVEQFHFHFQSHPEFGVFSPTTYRISVHPHNPDKLLILNVRNSEVLLQESGSHHSVTFSPDGNFIAAISGNRVIIWRYISGRYTQWREFDRTHGNPLYFSPTSSSILIGNKHLLHIFHFNHSPAAPTIGSGATIRCSGLFAYPSNGAYIATTHRGESAITITNLRSQNSPPSQFIDTGLAIWAIFLTGNVLLVSDSIMVVAWLLTEEGVLGGTFGERRVDRSDSLWDVQMPSDRVRSNDHLAFSVEGEIAAVKCSDLILRVYHTKTGEILNLDGAHLNSRYYCFGRLYSYCPDHYDSYKLHEPRERHWPVSQTDLLDGWVKDSEGKHRLWVHPRWRQGDGWHTTWLDQVTALRLSTESGLVIIKF